MSGEPHRSNVRYPGGLSARYRWAGSGAGAAVFALSEEGGTLHDYGTLVAKDPDRLCRAELRVESPTGTWTVRFASHIFDAPEGAFWDVPSLLVVKYGFLVYAFDARSGELRWTFRSGTPVLRVLGSSRLSHVLVQTEIETVALRDDGSPVWRVAHSEPIVEVELVGGRLVLTSHDGQHQTLDPESGQATA